jgi:hypothetical protein
MKRTTQRTGFSSVKTLNKVLGATLQRQLIVRSAAGLSVQAEASQYGEIRLARFLLAQQYALPKVQLALRLR